MAGLGVNAVTAASLLFYVDNIFEILFYMVLGILCWKSLESSFIILMFILYFPINLAFTNINSCEGLKIQWRTLGIGKYSILRLF